MERLSHDFGWVGLAKIGQAVRFFRVRNCMHVTMAGKIHKRLLFQPWAWFKHLPDSRADPGVLSALCDDEKRSPRRHAADDSS